MKLDAKTVARLSLDDEQTDRIHFDDALSGFGFRLRRGANGAELRSWVAQYRASGGRTRRVRIGSDLLSAAQARIEAEKILARVMLGQDPAGERSERKAKDRVSCKSVVAEFLETKRSEVRARSFTEIERYLTDRRYFGPLLGQPIDAVSQRDVAACLVTIIRERGAATARAARSALSALFVWSMQQALTISNPTVGTRKPVENGPRERVLSAPELVAIWRACRDDHFGAIVKLLILTGARRTEVGGLAWSEIGEDGVWTLPSQRAKGKRAHKLPLPSAALDIIATIPRIDDRDQLFGQRAKRGFSDWSAHKQLLDARSGVVDWRLHDLRRSFATHAADLGIAPHVISEILAHSKGALASTYNKSSYQAEVARALAIWSSHVAALVTGDERKVIPLLHG